MQSGFNHLKNPKDIKERIHKLDMINNPYRHTLYKPKYTKEQLNQKCFKCIEPEMANYDIDYRTNTIYRANR